MLQDIREMACAPGYKHITDEQLDDILDLLVIMANLSCLNEVCLRGIADVRLETYKVRHNANF